MFITTYESLEDIIETRSAQLLTWDSTRNVYVDNFSLISIFLKLVVVFLAYYFEFILKLPLVSYIFRLSNETNIDYLNYIDKTENMLTILILLALHLYIFPAINNYRLHKNINNNLDLIYDSSLDNQIGSDVRTCMYLKKNISPCFNKNSNQIVNENSLIICNRGTIFNRTGSLLINLNSDLCNILISDRLNFKLYLLTKLTNDSFKYYLRSSTIKNIINFCVRNKEIKYNELINHLNTNTNYNLEGYNGEIDKQFIKKLFDDYDKNKLFIWPMAHVGFLTSFVNSILPVIKPIIINLIKNQNIKKIYIIGHSLGACITYLLVFVLTCHFLDDDDLAEILNGYELEIIGIGFGGFNSGNSITSSYMETLQCFAKISYLDLIYGNDYGSYFPLVQASFPNSFSPISSYNYNLKESKFYFGRYKHLKDQLDYMNNNLSIFAKGKFILSLMYNIIYNHRSQGYAEHIVNKNYDLEILLNEHNQLLANYYQWELDFCESEYQLKYFMFEEKINTMPKD